MCRGLARKSLRALRGLLASIVGFEAWLDDGVLLPIGVAIEPRLC
jgi:hypothetical protein